jgi:holliday junction DNA helicase RuvA
MIASLTGRVVELRPGEAVLDVGGVGYEVRTPVSAHAWLAAQEVASVHVHTHVREDQISLFGFPTRLERDTFRLLIAVSGIGPRMALALLSGMSPGDLAAAIEGEHWRRLASVPGIGKRTAERLIVELKGKLAWAVEATPTSVRADAVSAMVNLGYPVRSAEEAVGELLRGDPDLTLTDLLPRALKQLVR